MISEEREEKNERKKKTQRSHTLLKHKQRECISRARILDYPSTRVLLFVRETGSEEPGTATEISKEHRNSICKIPYPVRRVFLPIAGPGY